MKNFKRILALLLALCMVFALCACDSGDKGKDKDDDDEEELTDAELIVGTWEATINMNDVLELMGESEDLEALAAYFDFSRIDVGVTFEFDKKGGYEFSFTVDVNDMQSMLRDGMEKMLEDMLVGSGYTVDDLAAEEGMTRDEYLDALMDESFDADEFTDIIEEANQSGSYEIKDGKIYYWQDGEELDEGNYLKYSLDEDDLTIKAEYVDGEDSDAPIYPLDLERK